MERHRRGIKVHVEVKPEVEEFFRLHGGGVKITAQHGRLWKTVSPDCPPLEFWSLEQNIKDPVYDVIRTGVELVNRDSGLLNIAFLRLVGGSEPGGKEFLLDSVISTPELRILGGKIVKASEKFYMDYIQRVNLRLYVGVVDMTRTI